MRSFDQFMRDKKCQALAEAIVAYGIDEQVFCEAVLDYARSLDPDSPEVLNEFWAGVGNVAGAGMNAIGRGIGAGARAVGGAIGAGARAVGGALSAGANAVGRGAQHVGNLYQQGELKSRLDKVMGTMQWLQQELGSMGFQDQQLDSMLNSLVYKIQQIHQQVAQDPTLRMGQQGLYKKQ